ncbi:MAG: pyridoxamine 5'-phosphate oxidase [Candidatus Baltobacteraceae bacterium]
MSFLSGRESYERSELHESGVDPDPLLQLGQWVRDAEQAQISEHNAMCVSSVNLSGQPSSRMVLLRGLDSRGLIFYTSYFSRKGRELTENPNVAALFYWRKLERQARIEGVVSQLSDGESDAYFATRPRGHQLGAWASEQSEPVESRELLDRRIDDYNSRFDGEDVPRPHSWGGYLIKPFRIEFWQGRPNRMHDRIEYTTHGHTWTHQRLQP